MKKLLKYIVNALALLGFVMLVVSASGWAMLLSHEKPKLPENIILSLDLSHKIEEKTDDNPLHNALGGEKSLLQLRDIVAALDMASHDPRVKVVLGTFGGNTISLAAAQEVQGAVMRLRDAGKLTYAFAPSFGEMTPADKAYYLATSFEEIWLQPAGLVGITGLAIEMPFGKKAMEKIGAEGDFIQRKEYKTLMENVTRDDFSEANTEMLGDLLDDLSMQFADDVAAQRHLSPELVSWFIDAAPLTAQVAQQAGFIDKIGYEDEIEDKLFDAYGEKTGRVDAADYLALRRDELQHGDSKAEKLPVVALIHAVGNIMQDGSGFSPGAKAISADDTVEAFAKAVADKDVEAILLRIDSPGGSAVASESIRRALVRAEMSGLPVIVSMGSVAGSGAYWIASAGDYILADPATLTGSIGVIAGKFYGTDIWDTLGISWSTIERGENSDMWSSSAPFTDTQRAKVDALVGDAYKQFKENIVWGRGLSPDAVEAVAKGRVWTGNEALNLGLVDELGGFYDAVQVSKNLLGLGEEDAVMLKIFPAPESLAQRIRRLFGRFGGLSASMGSIGDLLEQAEPLLQKIIGVLQMRPRDLSMPVMGLDRI